MDERDAECDKERENGAFADGAEKRAGEEESGPSPERGFVGEVDRQ